MNIVVKRLLTAVLSLLLIVYVGYQGYCALYNPIRTTRAYSGTYEDVIKTDCFVLHEETVIDSAASSKSSGVIDYVREDGENVAKGGEVAAVYKTEQDAASHRKIKNLQEQIEIYENMGDSSNASTIDIDVLNSEIQTSFLELSKAADSSDVSRIEQKKADMLSLLNKKQLATGEISNFDAQIAELKKQLSELSSKSGDKISSITAPEAGYFVSSVDGYENAYKYSEALSITASDVRKLLDLKATGDEDAVGKIISSYESYIVCTVGTNDAYKLHVGESVQMRFLLSSQAPLKVTVAAMNKSSSGVAVVFKCPTMSSTLATIRKQTVEIVVDKFTGIKVLNDDIHVVNGEKGVFVRSGDIVKFKKIDPIYSGAGYTVCAINASDDDYLQIYDEVIENGDDLYDGKIIK